MKDDWRRRCTLSNITTPLSINALKMERKRLKQLSRRLRRRHNDQDILQESLQNVNAFIKGKQFMFHTKYQYMKIKGRPFTWASFAKHNASKRG